MKPFIFLLSLLFVFTACEYITEVDDISKETINVLAPKNNTVLDTIAVSFSWL